MGCGMGAWLCGRGKQQKKIPEADRFPLGWGSRTFKTKWLGCQKEKAGGGSGRGAEVELQRLKTETLKWAGEKRKCRGGICFHCLKREKHSGLIINYRVKITLPGVTQSLRRGHDNLSYLRGSQSILLTCFMVELSAAKL